MKASVILEIARDIFIYRQDRNDLLYLLQREMSKKSHKVSHQFVIKCRLPSCTIELYVCTIVCMCICVYVCMYVFMYVCMCVSMYVCMYVHMYVCTYVCMCICVYVYMCVCMCLCMYVCV